MKRYFSFILFFAAIFCWGATAQAEEDIFEYIFDKPGVKISMDFKDADLKDVLKIFSQQSGLNFIASEKIKDRKLTLYLDGVGVKEALDKILKANNLVYELDEESNIFIVKEKGEPEIKTQTRVYHLKYAQVKGTQLLNEKKTRMEQEGEEEVGITQAIRDILSERGKVAEDSRTNSLIVTDIPARFAMIEEAVSRLDKPLPQVLIEVEMIDTTKKNLDKLGVEFGETPFNLTGAIRPTGFPFPHRLRQTKEGGSFSGTDFTFGTLDASGLTAALKFLLTQTDTKYLARPRILTISNETAEIKIKTDEAVGVTSTVTSAEGTATATEEAERVETGVSLRVTPQVNPQTGMITMYIEPSVSEAKDTTFTVSGNAVKDPETRQTKSIIMVKDGETAVIGGLIRNDDTEIVKKVPFLSDIPILGAAFRYKSKDKEERELVVFITPHILSTDADLAIRTMKELIPQREQEISLAREEAISKTLSQIERR